MGGAVNAVLEETLYVLTIAGVLVVQWFTHTAEHKAHHHRQVSETLAMMYRELTVLGIVAFCLFSLETSGIIHVEVADKHVFEKVHNSLFVVAVFYGLSVAAIAYISNAGTKYWENLEATSFRDWRALKARWDELKVKVKADEQDPPPGWLRYMREQDVREYYKTGDVVAFHDLRYFMIQRYGLKTTKSSFRLSEYLTMAKRRVFRELVEIESISWVFFATALTFDLLLRRAIESYAGSADITFHTIVVNVFLSAFAIVIMAKVMRASAYVRIRNLLSVSVEEAQDCEDDGFCSRVPAKERATHPETMAMPAMFETEKTTATGQRSRRKSTVHELVQQDMNMDPIEAVESLFWYKNPHLIPRLLQTIVFGWSLNVALMATYWTSVVYNSLAWLAVLVVVLSAAVIFAVVAFAIPMFTATVYAGEGTDEALLAEAVFKSERRSQSRRESAEHSLSRINFSHSGRIQLGGSVGRESCCSVSAGVRFSLRKRGIVMLLTLVYFFTVAASSHLTPGDSMRRKVWVVEAILGGLFLLEMLAEVIAYGPKDFFTFAVWNVVDLLLVAFVAAYTFLDEAAVNEDSVGSTVARSLIIIRLFRHGIDIPARYSKTVRVSHKGTPGAHEGAATVTIAEESKESDAGKAAGGAGIDLSELHSSAEGTISAKVAGVDDVDAGEDRRAQVELSDDDFGSTIFPSSDVWMVKVYADWCSVCKKFKPTWDEAADAMKFNCRWAEVEGDRNSSTADALGVTSFPTVLIFPKSAKDFSDAVKFSGERSVENLRQFVAKYRSATAKDLAELAKGGHAIGENAERIEKALVDKAWPAGDLQHCVTGDEPGDFKMMPASDLFHGKKVVVFAVPGAFTPTCSGLHVPGFVNNADAIYRKGVDQIYCLAVNDPFVTAAWGKPMRTTKKVKFIADFNGSITKRLGADAEWGLPGNPFGVRCMRFAAIVDHGIVKWIGVDDALVNSFDAVERSTAFEVMRHL